MEGKRGSGRITSAERKRKDGGITEKKLGARGEKKRGDGDKEGGRTAGRKEKFRKIRKQGESARESKGGETAKGAQKKTGSEGIGPFRRFQAGTPAPKEALCALRLFQASGADISFLFLAVRNERNFLNVYLKSSSRSALGVADVVAARLPLTADTAHFRHIDTSDRDKLP